MSAFAIISIILMVLVLGGMGFAVVYQIKKTDPSKVDSSMKNDIQTTQEFLPFDDIKDSMIHLGGHKYKAIIECSSINYRLRTEKEQAIIEGSFQRFLNSLTFPIVFYIFTKTIDNTKMLKHLEDKIIKTLREEPNLKGYCDNYYSEMSVLNQHMGNTKQKKKYVIVGYEDGVLLKNSNDEEKYDYSAKELAGRCHLIKEGLSSVGIKSKILNTKEILELVFSAYHKDNDSNVDGLLTKEYLELLVEGKNALSGIKDDDRISLILQEAWNKLQSEVMYETSSTDVKEKAKISMEEIKRLEKMLFN